MTFYLLMLGEFPKRPVRFSATTGEQLLEIEFSEAAIVSVCNRFVVGKSFQKTQQSQSEMISATE